MHGRHSAGHKARDILGAADTALEIGHKTTLYQIEPLGSAAVRAQSIAIPLSALNIEHIAGHIVIAAQMTERQRPRQQLIHHHSEGEYIRSGQHRSIAAPGIELLGRHIRHSAKALARHAGPSATCHTVVLVAANTEIGEHSPCIVAQQHILRLKVAVDTSGTVQIAETFENLPCQQSQVQLTLCGGMPQVASVAIFHYHIGIAFDYTFEQCVYKVATDDARGVILAVETAQQSFTLAGHNFPDFQQFERIYRTVRIGHTKNLAVCPLAQQCLNRPATVNNVTDSEVAALGYNRIYFVHIDICIKVNAFWLLLERGTPGSDAIAMTPDSRTAHTAERPFPPPDALRHPD